MGRKKSEQVAPASNEPATEKPLSKSACIRLALETLGIDVPYSAVVEWCLTEKQITVTSADIGNVKSALKKKQGGSVSAVKKPVVALSGIADLIEGLAMLKSLNADIPDKKKLYDHLEESRKFLNKFSSADITKLLDII